MARMDRSASSGIAPPLRRLCNMSTTSHGESLCSALASVLQVTKIASALELYKDSHPSSQGLGLAPDLWGRL